MSNSPPAPGRFAYDGLDRVIHEKARLGLLTALVTAPRGRTFTELKAQCGLTDGNLNRHLHALSEAGLVEVDKAATALGRRSQTVCRITTVGRERFRAYLAELERVVHDALPAADPDPDAPPGLAPGAVT